MCPYCSSTRTVQFSYLARLAVISAATAAASALVMVDQAPDAESKEKASSGFRHLSLLKPEASRNAPMRVHSRGSPEQGPR